MLALNLDEIQDKASNRKQKTDSGGNDCNGQTVFDSGKEIAARADDNAENHQNNRRTEISSFAPLTAQDCGLWQ